MTSWRLARHTCDCWASTSRERCDLGGHQPTCLDSIAGDVGGAFDAHHAAVDDSVFAVADGEFTPGVSGSAAREVCSSLLEVLDDPRCSELRPDLMLHRLHDANDRCHQLIGSRCAVTALWLWEDPDSESLMAGWAHVGNTRLYHHAGGQWKRLTRDHAKGRLLDRAVGQGPGLEIDIQ